jgi:hypothetical protein
MRRKRWDESDAQYEEAMRQYWWQCVFPAHCVWWVILGLLVHWAYGHR